jgi:hypothetical protein
MDASFWDLTDLVGVDEAELSHQVGVLIFDVDPLLG